jgi:hypothetical protein
MFYKVLILQMLDIPAGAQVEYRVGDRRSLDRFPRPRVEGEVRPPAPEGVVQRPQRPWRTPQRGRPIRVFASLAPRHISTSAITDAPCENERMLRAPGREDGVRT